MRNKIIIYIITNIIVLLIVLFPIKKKFKKETYEK